MSEIGVREFCRSTAAATALTHITNFTKVAAFRQLPRRQNLRSTIMVGIGQVVSEEVRGTLGGRGSGIGTGTKKITYAVDLLIVATGAAAASAGDDFTVFLDALKAQFRTVVLPATVTDPVTGATTQIQRVGEDMHAEAYEPDVDNDEEQEDGTGGLIFRAVLTLTVVEEPQG